MGRGSRARPVDLSVSAGWRLLVCRRGRGRACAGWAGCDVMCNGNRLCSGCPWEDEKLLESGAPEACFCSAAACTARRANFWIFRHGATTSHCVTHNGLLRAHIDLPQALILIAESLAPSRVRLLYAHAAFPMVDLTRYDLSQIDGPARRLCHSRCKSFLPLLSYAREAGSKHL